MKQGEIRDVAPGLWIWRCEYRDWKPDDDFEPFLTSTCVQSRGETLVLDPLAPPANDLQIWERLDRCKPTAAVILNPDHVRDVDIFVHRYAVRAFGPRFYYRDDIPQTDLERIEPGRNLPGGLVALFDGRGRAETPMWLPEQRTIAFADALCALGGQLRVWATPWHEERTLPALKALLDLPFELVIVSHGEPVHTRRDFEEALKRQPWSG